MKKTPLKVVVLNVLLLTALVAVGVLLIQVATRVFAGDQATALRQIIVLMLACGFAAYGIGTASFWRGWYLCGLADPDIHFIEMNDKEVGQLWSVVWPASLAGLIVGINHAFFSQPWQLAARCVLEAIPLYYAGWRMYYAGWRGAETAPKLSCTHEEVGHGGH